jgi:polyferredoxin
MWWCCAVACFGATRRTEVQMLLVGRSEMHTPPSGPLDEETVFVIFLFFLFIGLVFVGSFPYYVFSPDAAEDLLTRDGKSNTGFRDF